MKKFYLALSVVTPFLFCIICAVSYVAQATSKTEEVASSELIPKANTRIPSFIPFGKDERTQRIFKQEAIIDEGNRLVERGLYDAALAKFQDALNPEVLNEESDKGRAIYFIEKVYKLQGNYEKAFQELQWSINRNPNGTGWLDEKLELESLIRARDTGSPEPVYEHIRYLREKYKVPPKGYDGYSDIPIATIVRLYDHLGDYDGGVALIDDMVRYFSKRDRGFNPSRSRYCADLIKIREAFLQDKAEGRKSCIAAKPGEACVGRATQALIKSDYFPW